MNFNSFLPTDYENSLIHNILFCAYNICADYVTLHNETEILKSICQNKHFPFFFIDNCIKKCLDKLFIKQNISGVVSKKKEVLIRLEFLGKICFQSKKQLTEIFRTGQKNIKLNVVFRSFDRIRNGFRLKDQNCNICKMILNINETKRHFRIREYEYLGKSILTEKVLKHTQKDSTVIRKYCHNHCHTADTTCFSLVGNAAIKYHLKA